MNKRFVVFIVVIGIAAAFIGYRLWLNTSVNDVFLYLQCQDIKAGRLQITLLDDDNQPFYEKDFQLETSCDQAAMLVMKDARPHWLGVVLQLYSADGKPLFTKKGSRQQDDILLDQNGFHIDLKLNGEPPDIAFHSL